MKKIILFLIPIILIGCEKDQEVAPKDDSPKWHGIYRCTDLTDDSTGLIVDESTNLNILYSSSPSPDSISLSAVIDEYGSAYFHDVLSNQDTGNGVNALKADVQGNKAYINKYWWLVNGLINKLDSATITLIDRNTVVLEYTHLKLNEVYWNIETGETDTTWHTKTFRGTFIK